METTGNAKFGAEDVLEAPTGFVTDEMMEKADAWKERDESALAAVCRRAEAGEDITVALIGGSIMVAAGIVVTLFT